jgi:hypothetical protein
MGGQKVKTYDYEQSKSWPPFACNTAIDFNEVRINAVNLLCSLLYCECKAMTRILFCYSVEAAHEKTHKDTDN